MNKELFAIRMEFDAMREKALSYLKDFLSKNQMVIVIPESKIGESPYIASNIIINKNKLYTDYIEPEWEIRVNDLSFDEIYHIIKFLEDAEVEKW